MEKGKIKWYDETKGFGFIEKDGKDIFVHRSGLENPNARLVEGQEVIFDTKQSDKGEVAYNVKKA